MISAHSDFWEFLEKNVSSGESDEAQSLTSEAQLTRSAITITLETYLLKLRYRIQAIQKALELQRRKNTAEVKLMQVRVNERLISYHRHCEAEMMRLILQYNAIIQRELKDSKRMLGDEYEEKLLQRKQVKILRDIRLFANHLMMESRGKISFAMLNADSQQFSRCIKAVLDNVNAARGLFAGESDLNNRVRVLNVFKLQNTHISNKLQATSEKVSNGKIKGLFCCLSKESFYNFSVFGLHAQALPGRSPDDLSKLADNWLGTVWFHAEPPPGVPVTPEAAYVLKSAGTAAKLSQHRSRQLSPRSGADARIYAASPHILHFSRYSTISDIARFTEEQLNEGIFLSLCRVLVVKQKTIAKDIEDADIIEAVQEQYDCLYSTLREEYVLLQPKHVLPEFFMHTRFPYPSGAAGQDGTSPSKRDAARMANAKKEPRLADEMFTCSTKSTVESDEPAFPLENLLLHNAIECREAATASIGDALDSTTEANSSNSSSNSSPGHGLLKKEAIVKRLHTTVQDFRARSNKEIAESVRSLAHSLAIQL